MGGEGPYLRFNEDLRQSGASTTTPSPLDDKQLDEAYTRAHVFLLERVRQLVKLGWEQHEADDSLLAFVSYTRVTPSYWGDRQSRVELRLPRTASAWFEPSLVPQWKKMFERSALFQARRRRGSGSVVDRYAAYLYVDVEAPLRDIFNFLQCLIPDMLVIIRIDDIDDVGEEEITQRLPSSTWVEDYAGELHPIFGEERFETVAQASKKTRVSFTNGVVLLG